MNKNYIEDQTFEGTDFTLDQLPPGEYENCRFLNCRFADANLSHISFSECVFQGCDLSMVKVGITAFKEVQFKDCKLLGVHFEDSNPFLLAMNFKGCQLNLASFYKLNLKSCRWEGCNLHEVDFVEADLTGAVFDNSDLAGATFRNTMLEKADFRTALNYSIDPEVNKIRKAKFSLPGVVSLLEKYEIDIE